VCHCCVSSVSREETAADALLTEQWHALRIRRNEVLRLSNTRCD
jgi:hypothetical protein